MNNSQFTLDITSLNEPTVDRLPWLRSREGELVKIIESLEKVHSMSEWSTLKKYVFDGVVESLERRLSLETEKAELNQSEIFRLQGQLGWARKYADLKKLSDIFRLELTSIRKQING